jgi:hypothetical protein
MKTSYAKKNQIDFDENFTNPGLPLNLLFDTENVVCTLQDKTMRMLSVAKFDEEWRVYDTLLVKVPNTPVQLRAKILGGKLSFSDQNSKHFVSNCQLSLTNGRSTTTLPARLMK